MSNNGKLIKVESNNILTRPTTLLTEDLKIYESHYNQLLNFITYDSGNVAISVDGILTFGLAVGSFEEKRRKVAKILGKYAEALLVNQCNNKDNVNRYFARQARFGNKSPNDFLNNFVAIGTGLHETDLNYHSHYQPNETQRDVVWVDKRHVLSLLTIPKRSGAIAGLQIKVSYNWRYVTREISDYAYPIVYFDMNDDWEQLDQYIQRKKRDNEPGFHRVTLVPKTDYTEDVKKSLRWFERQLIDIIDGKLTIRHLVERAKAEDDAELAHALTKSKRSYGHVLLTVSSVEDARKIIKEQREAEIRREETFEHLRTVARNILNRG